MAILEKHLEELGLSYREARVYKSALELGRFSVAELSDRASVKRPTCYVILDELVRRGLVSANPNKKLPYTVEPPSVLIKQIEEKSLLAKSIMADLEAIYTSAAEKPLIKFYSGVEGAKKVYEDALKCKINELYYVASLQEFINFVGKDFLDDWLERRQKLGIRSYGIRMGETEVPEPNYAGGEQFLRDLRFAPKEIYIPYAIQLYGNKVGIVSTSRDGFGLIIESKDFFLTMKGFFDALWLVSK